VAAPSATKKTKKKKEKPSSKLICGSEKVAFLAELRTTPLLKFTDSKDAKEEKKSKEDLPAVMLLKRLAGTKGLRLEIDIVAGTNITVNTSAARYLQFFSSATKLMWNAIVNATEFNQLDVIFDEVFVRAVTLKFFARNKRSSNYSSNAVAATAAGEPGQLNTCGATLVFMPHNSPAYNDTSGAWINMSVTTQHRHVNLGADDWTWTVQNPDKFSWDGILGDETTTNATMGWLQFSSVANQLGGYFQIATPVASGAAAGLGTLTEGGVFGDLLMIFHTAMRARA